MSKTPAIANFLSSVQSSNEFKTLLADPSLTSRIHAANSDVSRVLDQVQRDYRSTASDAQEARLQEWAVTRAISEIRDILLLMSHAHQLNGGDGEFPEDEIE
jgi:predicted metal-dependent HD superfamily phosphohydrolase